MKYFYKSLENKEGLTLRGVINTPDDFKEESSYPTLVMFHGFGGEKNGQKWFRTENARYLTGRGFVVARFDFSGSGDSEGSYLDATITRQLDEASRIYSFVKAIPYVDRGNIFLHGHSLGGVLATLLAESLKPKALALLAPACDMCDPEVVYRGLDSFDKDFEKTIIDRDITEKDIREKLDRLDFESFDLGGVRVSKYFFLDSISHEVYKRAGAYPGPVQIIRGSKDEEVTRKSNLKLRAAFPQASYEEISGADHSFTLADVREPMFDSLYDFLKENLD